MVAPLRRAYEEPGAALDFPKVERNVRRMIDAGAPAEHVDQYLGTEGLTADQFREAMKGGGTIGESAKAFGRGADSVVRKIASGATFGGADEIAAGADALIGRGSQAPTFAGRYGENVTQERQRDAEFAKSNPVLSTAAEVAGGLGSGALLAATPMGAAMLGGGAGTIPARMGAGALGGAGFGGVTGFLHGEGGLEDRLKGAGYGAGTGAAIGGALPPVTAALGAAGRFIAETAPGRFVSEHVAAPVMRGAATVVDGMGGGPRIRPGNLSAAAPEGGQGLPVDTAAGRVAESLRGRAEGLTSGEITRRGALDRIAAQLPRDRMTPEQLAASLRDLGPDAMLFQAGGDATQRLARTMRNMPGQSGQISREALDAEARGVGKRMMADVGEATGSPGDFFGAFQRRSAQRSTEGRALYDAAGAEPPVISEGMRKLMNVPAIKGAIERERAAIAEYGQEVPEAIILDRVKQRMNEEARAAMQSSGKVTNKADMNATAQAWEDALWAANPKLRDASKAWRAASAEMDAMEAGRNFMAGGVGEKGTAALPEALAERFKGMTTGEKDAFRIGVASTLRSKVEGGADAARRVAKDIDSSDLTRDRLREVLGPMEADRIFKMAARERARHQAVGVVDRNSTTAQQTMDIVDQMGSAGGGSLGNRAFNAVGEWMRRSVAGNEPVRDQMGRILFSRDPVENALALEAIQQMYLDRIGRAPRAAVGLLGAGNPIAGAF